MRLRLLAAVGVLASLLPQAASADLLHDYDLVTIGDFNSTSDVEGTAFIGGSVIGNGGTFANHLSSTTGTTLTIAQNLNVQNQINLNYGGLVLGGAITHGNVNFNDPNHSVGITYDSSVQSLVSGIATQLGQLSTAYAAMPALSTVSPVGGSPAPITFTAVPSGPDNVAVFNIDGSLLSNGNVQNIILDNSAHASTIIINVTGTNVSFTNGVHIDDSSWSPYRATTLWNFVNATNIDLEAHWDGAILAPLADLHSNTAIDGAVFVKSITQGNQGEIHLPNYSGYVPNLSPVPEPSTLVLAGFGGVAALFYGVRRRRSA